MKIVRSTDPSRPPFRARHVRFHLVRYCMIMLAVAIVLVTAKHTGGYPGLQPVIRLLGMVALFVGILVFIGMGVTLYRYRRANNAEDVFTRAWARRRVESDLKTSYDRCLWRIMIITLLALVVCGVGILCLLASQ